MSEVIDNRANRIRTLKEIIKHLHAGHPADQVKTRMKDLVRQTDYSEIVAMEQELLAEGMPVEELHRMCDLHSQVTRDLLVQIGPTIQILEGHPADTFRCENAALRKVLDQMRGVIAELDILPDEDSVPAALIFQLRQAWNELMDIEKHYQRKEHVFFSHLEKHGITGPSKVMWGKDDEVRAYLKELGRALRGDYATAEGWKLVANVEASRAVAAVEEMISKEENILLPMCLRMFTEEEWGEIYFASTKYGWCLVEPREGYQPPTPDQMGSSNGVALPTGNLSIEQLEALFSTLPVDITYVDADDRVAFFSEGPDRVFARSRAVIGRKVQNCHPPKSVDTVDRILNDFRSGRQNVAEFWLTFHGRFVHVRYFAVRDKAGQYMGTLEVTQDVTRIRQSEGERRLLEYETLPSRDRQEAVQLPIPARIFTS